jgi:hypothetical protein
MLSSQWLSLKADGDGLHKAHDFGAAAAAYTAALHAAASDAGALSSQHAVLYSNRAGSNLELGRPLLALEDAEAALRLGGPPEQVSLLRGCWSV